MRPQQAAVGRIFPWASPIAWDDAPVVSKLYLSLQSDVALCDAVVFTILRHLSLSSAALTASCSVIPVELLMSYRAMMLDGLSFSLRWPSRWRYFFFLRTFCPWRKTWISYELFVPGARLVFPTNFLSLAQDLNLLTESTSTSLK